jgi:hypothetical protein
MKTKQPRSEEFKVDGKELVEQVKKLVKEGTARRILIKSTTDKTLLEIPLVLGAVGILLAPLLAGIAAIAALVTKCTIVVERDLDK